MSRFAVPTLIVLVAMTGCAATVARGRYAPPERVDGHRRPDETVAAVLPSAVEAAILVGTNRFRSDHGLPPLRMDPALQRFARSRSQDMADRHYFAHTEPGGKDVFRLMRDAGIAFHYGAENIHLTRGVPLEDVAETAMDGWIHSPGHRANLLATQPTLIGVGVVRTASGATYSTQVFAHP